MKQITKKLLAALLILAMVAVFPWTPLDQTPQASAASTISDLQNAVTLHCWNWSYRAIEQKMATIAGMGYTAIQVSPIQQAKQATAGFQFYDWWVYYQPASFSIDNTGTSALGTKAEFQSMCDTAHQYGVAVIVDVVSNHMGNSTTDNTLSPTIIADLRNDSSCWHNKKSSISNYYDRYNITQYNMDGLPDLNTASKKVQNYVLNFLKECVDAGADGFRFDGAKHIETPDDSSSCKSDFWPTVINGIKAYAPDVYVYGEVLYSPDDGGQLGIDAYTKYMSVTDNTWGVNVRSSVIDGKNASAFSYQYHKNTTADNLVIWAESHDNWADGHDDCDNNCKGCVLPSKASINKTWALVAARADAMALYLARPDSISQQLGTASSGTGWDSLEVAYVNRFHTKFIGQSEYIANESGIAYVERGTSGVVLVNCSGTSKSISVTAHNIKDGSYTDQITGNTFTVSGGKIKGNIGSTGIAVVYAESPCAHSSHNTDGICTACSLPVGHTYNSSGFCTVCGKNGSKMIYFRNTDGWSTVNIYAWNGDTEYTRSWPGNAMSSLADGTYYFLLPPNAENVIFNNGSTQTSDLLVPTDANNLYDFATGTWSVYGNSSTTPDPSTPTPSTPSTSTPSASTPSATTPSASTPSASTPSAGTPSASTPSASTPSASTPAASQPAGNTDTQPADPGASQPDTPVPSEPDASQPDDSGDDTGNNSGIVDGNGSNGDTAGNDGDSTGNDNSGNGSSGSYWWIALVIAGLAIVAVVILLLLRRKKPAEVPAEEA